MADTGPVEAPVVTKIGEPGGKSPKASRPQRSLQRRLFSVGLLQVAGLVAASVLLGLFLLSLDLDPTSDSLNLRGAVWGVIQGVFRILRRPFGRCLGFIRKFFEHFFKKKLIFVFEHL